MQWIALYLPELSLQLAQRGMEHAAALVVRDGPESRPLVFAANEAALATSITTGMPLAAAQALHDKLHIVPRTVADEDAALANLASWAGQFSPNISIEPQQGLLLEVEASLTLFGGLTALLGRLRRGVHELGYRAAWGVAPTPLAASLFAKRSATQTGVRMCTDTATLRARLAPLPLALFDWPSATLDKLNELGICSIADCLALPRAGLSQRLSEEIVLALDRALGDQPDPRPFFAPPETFSARLELPAAVTDAERLLFPLRRLLNELGGFLCARGAGVQELVLVLEQEQRVCSRLTLGLLAPERDSARLLKLLRERLARANLAAPVLALRVEADRLLPYTPANASWLPDRQTQALQWTQLQERLRARLGPRTVFTPHAADDHRPERAWSSINGIGEGASTQQRRAPTQTAPRPLWLLREAHALLANESGPAYRGNLDMLAGPERIEAGWWDEKPVSRDYFVARNPRGETLWVYRELSMPRQWYLHGVFA
jgi:protein ImuB